MAHYICTFCNNKEFDSIEQLSEHVRANHKEANDASKLFH